LKRKKKKARPLTKNGKIGGGRPPLAHTGQTRWGENNNVGKMRYRRLNTKNGQKG